MKKLTQSHREVFVLTPWVFLDWEIWLTSHFGSHYCSLYWRAFGLRNVLPRSSTKVHQSTPHMGKKKKKKTKSKARSAGQERTSNAMLMVGALLLILALIVYTYMRPAISTNKRAKRYYESRAKNQQEYSGYQHISEDNNFRSDHGDAQENLLFEEFNAEDFDPGRQSLPQSRYPALDAHAITLQT